MGGKRRRGGRKEKPMDLDDVISHDSLNVCMIGNLRGVKESKMIRVFLECEGFAGYKKIKKAVSLNFGHIDFENKDQKEKSLRAIKDVILKNAPILFTIKREQTYNEAKKPRLNAEDINIQDVVTPLWKMSYEDQLKHKARFVNQTLFHITKQTLSESKHCIPEWIKNIDKMRGPCCEYDLAVVPSPVIYNYRNKSSYTAGLDINEKPILGFALGAVKNEIDCIGVSFLFY